MKCLRGDYKGHCGIFGDPLGYVESPKRDFKSVNKKKQEEQPWPLWPLPSLANLWSAPLRPLEGTKMGPMTWHDDKSR